MHPLLFKIGNIPIHTYGVMIAMGFLIGVSIIRHYSLKYELPVERMLDMTFWALLIGLAGSRLLFVVTRLDYFAAHPLQIFQIWQGGLVFLGSPLTIVPFMFYYLRKYKIDGWIAGDIIVSATAIGQAFGRLGCIGAGCCYGKPTGGEWGFQLYSSVVAADMRGIYLHPTQLYESVAMFMIFGLLTWVHRRRQFNGQVFLTYFMVYPVVRSIIEVFRGDLIRGFVIPDLISTSQFISILLFIAATTMMVRRLKANG